MNNIAKNIAIWIVIGIALLTIFQSFGKLSPNQRTMGYSDLINKAKAGEIASVEIGDSRERDLTVLTRSGETFMVYYPINNLYMVDDLLKANVTVTASKPKDDSFLSGLLVTWLPLLLLVGWGFFIMRQMQGGGKGGAFSFGKSKARMIDDSANSITFADVAGCDEAKEEVSEIVEFLRDPTRFQKLGGRIPKGVLMVGSPGTG